jgi:hypothetical protein
MRSQDLMGDTPTPYYRNERWPATIPQHDSWVWNVPSFKFFADPAAQNPEGAPDPVSVAPSRPPVWLAGLVLGIATGTLGAVLAVLFGYGLWATTAIYGLLLASSFISAVAFGLFTGSAGRDRDGA